MDSSIKFFDPETLARIQPIGLRARTLVEGLMAGMHRSPLRGQSIEFSQHRKYVPGDDLRQVDWKVFARSDKYYVRQHEDETNLSAMILIDCSESMDYRSHPQGLTKLEYAQLVACALGYLVSSQQDQVGLATFTDRIGNWLAPSSSPAQLDEIIRLLEQPHSQERSSDLARALEYTLDRLRKPTLVILLSDLLNDQPDMLRSFELLRLARHDLFVFHLLDRWELTFPFDGPADFLGLEELPALSVDPSLVAGAYRRAMQQFCSEIELACQQCRADYVQMVTDQPLVSCLPAALWQRSLRRR